MSLSCEAGRQTALQAMETLCAMVGPVAMGGAEEAKAEIVEGIQDVSEGPHAALSEEKLTVLQPIDPNARKEDQQRQAQPLAKEVVKTKVEVVRDGSDGAEKPVEADDAMAPVEEAVVAPDLVVEVVSKNKASPNQELSLQEEEEEETTTEVVEVAEGPKENAISAGVTRERPEDWSDLVDHLLPVTKARFRTARRKADTALARALEREAGEDARGKTQAEEWFEVMLQDVAGRLGAVRRSRQRIQRAFKEDAARSGAMDKEAVSAEFTRESAACVLAACSATMLRELDSGLEKEGEALEQWLQQLDALRQMQNTIEIAAAAQAAQAAST